MLTVETQISIDHAGLLNAVAARERRKKRREQRRSQPGYIPVGIGWGGPVRRGRAGATAKVIRTPRGKRLVTFALMRSDAQVSRANTILAELYGPAREP